MAFSYKKITDLFISYIFISVVGTTLFYVVPAYAEMCFIPNQGQWNYGAKFRAEIPGGYLYIFNDRILYHFFQPHASGHTHFMAPAARKDVSKTQAFYHHDSSMAAPNVVEVIFTGGAKSPIVPSQPSEDVYNYFYGNDPLKWVSNVHSYAEILMDNLYNGISLHLYFQDNALKYDWIVLPGADPSQIQLEYKGADEIKIADQELVLAAGENSIIENAPVAFTEEDGNKRKVACQYILKKNMLSFSLPDGYDRSQRLIIDPKLVFSSYSGSYANNWGNTATYDAQGNLYTGGIAFEPGFPITPSVSGGFSEEYHTTLYYGKYYDGTSDVVIMKFNSTGTKRLFSTYLGGNFQETPHSMIVNNAGELIVMGSTSSSNFPVIKGFDITFNGGVTFDPFGYAYSDYDPDNDNPFALYQNGSDIFVVKFSAGGETFLAGTFLGGSGNDGILEMSNPLCRNYGDQFRGEVNLDAHGNILVAAASSSFNFPVKNGKQYSGGGTDGVLAKLTNDLSNILWSTYLGGSGQDAAFGVCIDKQDNVLVTGGTNSQDFAVVLASSVSIYGGNGDGFLQKYSASGVLTASRYTQGTSYYDQSYLVQCDSSNNVYIFGQTKGQITVSPGIYSNKNSGQFLQKYSNSLDNVLFSTVVGSGNTSYGISPDISPTAFLVSDCGMIYIAGWGGGYNNETTYYTPDLGINIKKSNYYVGGYTNNMPVGGAASEKPYQSTTDGEDFYVMVLDRNASQLIYATYFGGPNTKDHVDGGTSRFDKNGNIYECVCACFTKSDYPTTPGVVSNTNNSLVKGDYYCNNAAFKFELGYLKVSFDTYSSTHQGPKFEQGCKPLQIDIVNTSEGGITYSWNFGDGKGFNGFAPPNHVYKDTGSYEIVLKATNLATCQQEDSAKETIMVKGFDLLLKSDTICIDSSGRLTASVNPVNKTYVWYLNTNNKYTMLSEDSSIVQSPSQDQTYLVVVKDTVQHCVQQQTASIHVVDIRAEASSGLDNDCNGKTQVVFTNHMKDSGAAFWDFGDGTSSTEQQPVHPYAPGTYTVHLTTSSQQCRFDTSFKVIVEKIFVPNLYTPNKDGQNESFEVKGIQGAWKLDVYNRWGAPVFQSNAYSNEWNGAKESDGLYYYLLTSPFGNKCKGWVELVR